MLCNEILYVLGREMTGGLADEGPALFNYAATGGFCSASFWRKEFLKIQPLRGSRIRG
jgi:hypothetical protein